MCSSALSEEDVSAGYVVLLAFIFYHIMSEKLYLTVDFEITFGLSQTLLFCCMQIVIL